MRYTAADATLRTTLLRNGAPAGPVKDVTLSARFTNYRVDTVAVASYSDTGAQGSLLANGVVDSFRVELPPPPVGLIRGQVVGEAWQVTFAARTNWAYALERTSDLRGWTGVITNTPAAAGAMTLSDPQPPGGAFYRVRADKP
jgi:hypothetical protein